MRKYKNRKGVTLIHLFNEVWRCGRVCKMKDGRNHVVITGPDDIEYHVYDKEARELGYKTMGWDGQMGYSRVRINTSAVKVHILTSILDERKNWSFDMRSAPKTGTEVKVVYDNGTIKNIEFDNHWNPEEIIKHYYLRDGSMVMGNGWKQTIRPIAWKIR